VSSDSTNDNMNEIEESNIPAEPSKSFEFSYADYEYMIVPTELSFTKSSDFIAMSSR